MAISRKSYQLLEELQRSDIEVKTEAKIELEWKSDDGPVYMVVAREANDNWSFDYVDKNGKSIAEPFLYDEDMHKIRDVLSWFLETFQNEN